MEMNKLMVKADGYYVQILTNCNEMEQYITKFSAVFNKLALRFELINKNFNSDIDATVVYNDEEKYELSCDVGEKKIVFSCPWEEICDCTLFAMVFRYFVEFLRQMNGEIKLHASSVCDDVNTALFIAPSEGGKTTTAMALCQKYGYSLKSNDAAVTKFEDGNPIMLRGDCIINARMNGLEAYSSDMFNDVQNMGKGITNPWNQKMNLNPEEFGMLTNKEARRVTHIFFVKLDVLIEEVSITKYSADVPDVKKNWFKHKMEVFQNIGGTIRGTDFFPSGNGGRILPLMIPSIDNEKLCQERIDFLNKLFEKCEVYEIRGKLDAVTENINNILKMNKFD